MFNPYRTKKWVFKIKDCTHKVELRLSPGKKVAVTVDGVVIEWQQTWLDLLDLGGKFEFVLHSSSSSIAHGAGPPANDASAEDDGGGSSDVYSGTAPTGGASSAAVHQCYIIVNTVNSHLFVDGIDVLTGRRRIVSVGRLVVRVVIVLLVVLAFLHVVFDWWPSPEGFRHVYRRIAPVR